MAKKTVAVKVKGKPTKSGTPIDTTPKQSVVIAFNIQPK